MGGGGEGGLLEEVGDGDIYNSATNKDKEEKKRIGKLSYPLIIF